MLSSLCSHRSVILVFFLCGSTIHAAEVPAEQAEFFEKQVRPILVNRCYECHSEKLKEPKGGLRLDGRAALLRGGDTGPALVPHKPGESLLVDAVNYGDTYKMPPKSKLPAEEIAVLTKWVEQGAPWPGIDVSDVQKKADFSIAERKAAHWCWQPIVDPPLPAVKNQQWPVDAVDRFILAKLEKEGFTPAAQVEKRTLLRRLYLDLIGLPPTPEQVQAYLSDDSPEATAKVVDELLKSPQFGERWGRHWLDLMRYAESRGHEFDYSAPNAYQYRDYVIRALNADVPYRDFLIEHIAGDLLPQPRKNAERGFNESILATGSWFLGEWVHSPVDIRKDETDRFDNMVDVFGKSFLGLTISCARCHDHKFDAISQKDYYALFGYLQSSGYRIARFETMLEEQRIAQELETLDARYRTQFARSLGEQYAAAPRELGQYLTTAIECLALGPEYEPQSPEEKKKRKSSDLPAPLSQAYRAKIVETAEKRLLDSERLVRWTKQLLSAAKSPSHPLHLLAVAAADPHPEAVLKQRIGALNTPAASAPQVQTIIDYAKLSPEDWRANGPTFGTGPAAVGRLLLGDDEAHPVRDAAIYSSARRDPAWNVLRPGPGAEREVGRLGELDRAGRTIRTPTFRIAGRLHYLVRGRGYAYAAVDSHATIAGPLHGAIVANFMQGNDALRWITHDLSVYKGHRAHIEFTATEQEPLEILAVVQGDHVPPLPTSSSHQAQALKLKDADKPTLADVVRTNEERLREALVALRENKLPERTDAAEWISWLLTERELFTPAAATDKALATNYLAERKAITARIRPESQYALVMWDGNAVDETLLIRGNVGTVGPVVPRRLPEAFAGPESTAPAGGSGRLELARQMVDQPNPLVARVAVNRVWHHLFGRGIVPSVDNFGVLGQTPTHPELLDHLAVRFANDGWSMKKLIRSIVLSRTYQMSSSVTDPQAEQRDPKNLLWRRTEVRRLQAEIVRDEILAVSGRLDLHQFGPSVPVHLTEFLQGRGRPGSGPVDGNGRRSIYLSVRRNFLSPMLMAFDAPTPFSSMGRRNVSNVPAQALILMNDPFVLGQAEVWAKRVLAAPGQDEVGRIARMYEAAFARPPSETEIAEARAFLANQAREHGLPPGTTINDVRPWADLAHVLMNVKEFIFLN